MRGLDRAGRVRRAAAALGLMAFAASPTADAQVHGDVGVELGAMQRLTAAKSHASAEPSLGPVAEIHGHVALLPMVRVGAYLSHDISPIDGAAARQITEAGVRAKVTPPLLLSPWRAWAFAGLGYARVYEPSHMSGGAGSATGATGGEASRAVLDVGGAGGGLLEVPLGLGVGAKVWSPWMLFAELSARVGFAVTGALYERSSCSCSGPFLGKDALSVALSVGVSLEP